MNLIKEDDKYKIIRLLKRVFIFKHFLLGKTDLLLV